MVLSLVPESTRIQHWKDYRVFKVKVFSFDFRTLAVSWSTRYASAQGLSSARLMHWACGVETPNARVPRYEPQKLAHFDTYELLRGRTNTRWASNRKLKNELWRTRMSLSTNCYAGGANTRLHRQFLHSAWRSGKWSLGLYLLTQTGQSGRCIWAWAFGNWANEATTVVKNSFKHQVVVEICLTEMHQEGHLGKNLVNYQHNPLQPDRHILSLFAYRCLFCRWQRPRCHFLRTRLRQPPPRSRPAPVFRPPPHKRPLPVPAAPPPRRRRLHSPMSSSTTSTVSGAFSSVLRKTVMTRRRRIAFTAVITDIAELSVITSASTGTFALPALSLELKRRLRIRRVQIIVIQAPKSRTLLRRLSVAQCRTSRQHQYARTAPTSLWKLLARFSK